MQNFIDPDYSLHILMSKVLSDLILRLSDSSIIPFDVLSLIDIVDKGKQILLGYEAALRSADINIGKNIITKTLQSFFDLFVNRFVPNVFAKRFILSNSFYIVYEENKVLYTCTDYKAKHNILLACYAAFSLVFLLKVNAGFLIKRASI